ncbi:MAG: nucleotide sugar dehydrogenase [Bryobacteraceae bacterium]
MKDFFPSTKVAVVGLGYVGCVTGACLSSLGHAVVGVDRDEHKVNSVLRGQAPFFEPGLEELIRENVNAGLYTASTSLPEAIADADVALICVGTPSEKNGNLGLEQLRRVVTEIAGSLAARSKPLIVAIRSTVFPGTCEELVMPILGENVPVVSNPEFLREGVAVRDFMEPSLVVVGGDDAAAVQRVAGLYSGLNVPASLVSLRTAEMIKYACNAFHATKIAFANEIGALSEKLGVNATEVMDTVCADVKLNASAAYLKPGFAFGGSCLPKDLRALVYRAGRLDLTLPLLESVLPSNEDHLTRALSAVLDLPAKRLGVIGLAFKENTDDLRESPVVSLLEQLIGKGRDVRVFDAHIQLETIYGSNRNFILESIPHIGRLMEARLDAVLGWADHLVVAQKQNEATVTQIRNSGLPVLDLVRSASFAPQMALV